MSLFIDKAASWRPGTLFKSDFSTGLFLCIFWNTFWCELADILLFLFADIFLILLLVVVLPYQIPDKVFVNPTGWMKSCFHVVDCHFSECLLNFYLNLIGWLVEIWFFSWESAKKVENSQPFFSLIFFSAVFQMSRFRMLSSKIRRNFLPAWKF